MGISGDIGSGPGDDGDDSTYRSPADVIPWGRAVAKVVGTDGAVALPSSDSDVLVGVARRGSDTEDRAHPIKKPFAVRHRGPIVVDVEEAVTPDDAVFVRFASQPHVVDISFDKGLVTSNVINGNINGEAIEEVAYASSSEATFAALAAAIETLEIAASAELNGTDPHVLTLTFSGNLITGNTVNGSINGVSISAVPFNTSNAQTLTDLAAAIQALASVATATSNGTNAITITGQVDGTYLFGSFAVTGGASQATGTLATVSGPVNVITVTGANGGETLLASFTVTGGAIQAIATPSTNVAPSNGTQLGIFRTDDDDTGNGATAVAWPRAKFIKGGAAGGVALLDINLP